MCLGTLFHTLASVSWWVSLQHGYLHKAFISVGIIVPGYNVQSFIYAGSIVYMHYTWNVFFVFALLRALSFVFCEFVYSVDAITTW